MCCALSTNFKLLEAFGLIVQAMYVGLRQLSIKVSDVHIYTILQIKGGDQDKCICNSLALEHRGLYDSVHRNCGCCRRANSKSQKNTIDRERETQRAENFCRDYILIRLCRFPIRIIIFICSYLCFLEQCVRTRLFRYNFIIIILMIIIIKNTFNSNIFILLKHFNIIEYITAYQPVVNRLSTVCGVSPSIYVAFRLCSSGTTFIPERVRKSLRMFEIFCRRHVLPGAAPPSRRAPRIGSPVVCPSVEIDQYIF